MPRTSYAWIPLLLMSTASHADNCDSISAEIDAKIRATGATNFTLRSIGANESSPGKVVGTCALGQRKIIYTAVGRPARPASAAMVQASAGSAPTASPRKTKRGTVTSEIITECKDGSMSLGGECKN